MEKLGLLEWADYPVRRRGERRRLNPNQAGINWLEGEAFQAATEITEIYLAGELNEFRVSVADGWYGAKHNGMYPRPMFQVFGLEVSSMIGRQVTPCPDCDNWAYTSRCQVHHDRDGIAGLEMGPSRRTTGAHGGLAGWYVDTMRRHYRAIENQVTIEVDGETLQGVRNFSYQTERWTDGPLTF
jgi:hypothetical protein